MTTKETLDQVHKRFFIENKMHESGIVPMNQENIHYDIRVAFKKFEEKDSRILKRKFRKLWRKYVKRLGLFERDKSIYGIGFRNPTKQQKLARKQLVLKQIYREYIDFKICMRKELL